MNNRKKAIFNDSGFSMIELLLVVVIIGIIASITIPRYRAAVAKSNEGSALASVKLIRDAEITYLSTKGGYAHLGVLKDEGLINDDITATGGATTVSIKHGFEFQTTMDAGMVIISGIPVTPGGILSTGNKRFGSAGSGVLYVDRTLIDTHYLTASDLTSGTSEPFQEK